MVTLDDWAVSVLHAAYVHGVRRIVISTPSTFPHIGSKAHPLQSAMVIYTPRIADMVKNTPCRVIYRYTLHSRI